MRADPPPESRKNTSVFSSHFFSSASIASAAFYSHKRGQHERQPLHHRMRRFPNRHHAELFEIPQIDSRFTARQHCSLAQHLTLHRRGNIDGRQGFVENLPGQLLQLRHERLAWRLVTVPSELPDSKCSLAAVP